MQLIRGIHNLRPSQRGCVATIGNFDGVHLGHQAVIGQLGEEAGRLDLPSVLITFEPQPLEYFRPQQAPARLTRLREKVEALRRFHIDRLLCLPFNRKLAQMPAEDFIRQVLVDGLGVKYLVVGDDFRFGKGRVGDFAMLQAAGREHGFAVVNMHTFAIEGERVSSTRVREAMNRATPLQGIFVVEVFGIEGEPLPGVASLGTRPTVDGKTTILEVYLFDFDRDIYGEHLQVSFLHKLRDEVRYTTLDALKIQIGKDVEDAQRYFQARHGFTPARHHPTGTP
ncbi:MAG: bifunctional riboflavin kinase/FMN adenylyltransferase [Gammaproteobacteria bacterium]